MSASRLLLDTLLPSHAPWQPDERGAIVFTIGDDVIVSLVEDETAEEVHMFSAAGYLCRAEDTRVDLSPGTAGLGRFSVQVAPHSGLVVPLRTLGRAQLDEVTFCSELAGHVHATRALAAALRDEAADAGPRPHQQRLPAAERPQWLACGMEAADDGKIRVKLHSRRQDSRGAGE